jgi:hypothetical protein
LGFTLKIRKHLKKLFDLQDRRQLATLQQAAERQMREDGEEEELL